MAYGRRIFICIQGASKSHIDRGYFRDDNKNNDKMIMVLMISMISTMITSITIILMMKMMIKTMTM